jgi:GT2 family glycosyltransferase
VRNAGLSRWLERSSGFTDILRPAKCLETVGYIDEQFSGCFNDVDYALRIRHHGGEVAIVFAAESRT